VKSFTPVLNVVVQEEYSRLTGMPDQCGAKRFIILEVFNIFSNQAFNWEIWKLGCLELQGCSGPDVRLARR
jgi:hypothetical protein